MDLIKRVPVFFFVAVLLVGCGGTVIKKEVEIQVGNAQPTPLPTMDIEATVEARVQEELEKISSTPTPTIPSPIPTRAATENSNTCLLTGGEIVQEGWSGKDTNSNSCNQCRCLQSGLACTKMACQLTVKPASTPTPLSISTPTAAVIAVVVASPEVPSTQRPTGGRPADRYACVINVDGYCVFTGSPHELVLKPGTEEIINLEGNLLFSVKEAVAVNASGTILVAKGTPAFDGDTLVQASKDEMTDDEKAFHRVMAIMFPIRNALMYDIPFVTQVQWGELVSELRVRGIKETTFTKGATPRDNYYGRQGIFDLAKNPKGRDIHHDVMKFLEESGLYLLCHVTSDEFNGMLRDTHPENHDPCKDAEITSKISFGAS